MRFIYICGVLPESVNNKMKLSVAGNKFSLKMAKALNECVDGKIDVITTFSLDNDYDLIPLFDDKIAYPAKRKGGFVVCEFYQSFMIYRQLKKLRRLHPKENIVLLIENSPFSVMMAVALFKMVFRVSAFSIIIDTPFVNMVDIKTLAGKINRIMFLLGQRMLRHFNGIISFTEDVEKDLSVNLPFHKLSIGHDETDITPCGTHLNKEVYTIVYAGTLIHYNGTVELLEAFEHFDNRYQLHIYGYGPCEEIVKQKALYNSNIVYHGRFDPENTRQILQMYDAAINPRIIDANIENYTFPSKLVDYILSGRPIISSNFKTMPSEYKDFLFLLDDVSPMMIEKAVIDLFNTDARVIEEKTNLGIRFVIENQSYLSIAQGIVKFIFKNVKQIK